MVFTYLFLYPSALSKCYLPQTFLKERGREEAGREREEGEGMRGEGKLQIFLPLVLHGFGVCITAWLSNHGEWGGSK